MITRYRRRCNFYFFEPAFVESLGPSADVSGEEPGPESAWAAQAVARESLRSGVGIRLGKRVLSWQVCSGSESRLLYPAADVAEIRCGAWDGGDLGLFAGLDAVGAPDVEGRRRLCARRPWQEGSGATVPVQDPDVPRCPVTPSSKVRTGWTSIKRPGAPDPICKATPVSSAEGWGGERARSSCLGPDRPEGQTRDVSKPTSTGGDRARVPQSRRDPRRVSVTGATEERRVRQEGRSTALTSSAGLGAKFKSW